MVGNLIAGDRLEDPTQRDQLRLRQMLYPDELVARFTAGADELVELRLDRRAVPVLGVLERNTIRKVTMVVPVLTMSCQVSEKPKKGPLTAHAMMTSTQSRNAIGRPVA